MRSHRPGTRPRAFNNATECLRGTPYADAVDRYPPLTGEEEEALFRRIACGGAAGRQARASIVSANLRLVMMFARRFINEGVPYEDLIQDGNLGLLKAVDRFDPAKGQRFSTYAAWWICSYVARAIRTHARTVRIPEHIIVGLRESRKEIRRLPQTLGREPTFDEIILHLCPNGQPTKPDGERLRLIWRTTCSLDSPVGNTGNNEDAPLSVGIGLEDKKTVCGLSEIIAAEEIERFQKTMAMIFGLLEILPIPWRDSNIFRCYYRHGANNPKRTLRSLGSENGVSGELVRQICAKIWRQLEILGSPFDAITFPKELKRIQTIQEILFGNTDIAEIKPVQFTSWQKAELLSILTFSMSSVAGKP